MVGTSRSKNELDCPAFHKKRVITLAFVVELEHEGRGDTSPDITPMTRRRVGSNSSSPYRYLDWLASFI